MDIKKIESKVVQIRFSAMKSGRELGRAFLLLGHNDLHKEPFGLLEDVFVEGSARRDGIGNALVKAVIQEATRYGCYKLIATSRFSRDEVHRWYERLGFVQHGLEFRMDLALNQKEEKPC